MKKLISVLLILLLALPVTVFAADTDPIVGQWYFMFDSVSTPEMAANFDPYERIITVYSFLENGSIMALELDVQDGAGTPTYYAAGKWEKSGDNYKCSIIGFGEGTTIIEEDSLLLSSETTQGIYVRFRKMIPFNPYKDYVYK